MGALGDVIGRNRAMVLTLSLMAAGALLSGVALWGRRRRLGDSRRVPPAHRHRRRRRLPAERDEGSRGRGDDRPGDALQAAAWDSGARPASSSSTASACSSRSPSAAAPPSWRARAGCNASNAPAPSLPSRAPPPSVTAGWEAAWRLQLARRAADCPHSLPSDSAARLGRDGGGARGSALRRHVNARAASPRRLRPAAARDGRRLDLLRHWILRQRAAAAAHSGRHVHRRHRADRSVEEYSRRLDGRSLQLHCDSAHPARGHAQPASLRLCLQRRRRPHARARVARPRGRPGETGSTAAGFSSPSTRCCTARTLSSRSRPSCCRRNVDRVRDLNGLSAAMGKLGAIGGSYVFGAIITCAPDPNGAISPSSASSRRRSSWAPCSPSSASASRGRRSWRASTKPNDASKSTYTSWHHLRRPLMKQLRRRHLHRDAAVDQPEPLQPSRDERRIIAAGVGVAVGAPRDARRLLRAELAVHLGQVSQRPRPARRSRRATAAAAARRAAAGRGRWRRVGRLGAGAQGTASVASANSPIRSSYVRIVTAPAPPSRRYATSVRRSRTTSAAWSQQPRPSPLSPYLEARQSAAR